MNALVIARQRLRVYRRPLLLWTVSLAALGGLTVLFWPAVRDASGLEELMAGLPEAMKALVGSQDLTSPEGFVNSRLASIFPLLVTVYAAFRIADEVAGEEQSGGFEIVLGHPVGRGELLLGTAAAVAVAVAVLMTGTGLAMAAAGLVVDIGIPLGHMLAATTALAFLGWSSLGIALAIAGVTGRRGLTLGAGVGLSVAMYVLYSFAPLVPALDGARPWTTFAHALAYDPLSNGLQLRGSLILLAVAVAGAAVGTIAFQRRDVGV